MIAIKKILVPTDLTDRSVPVIGFAIALAKKNAAQVNALHVLAAKSMQDSYSHPYVTDELVTPVELSSRAGSQGEMESVFDKRKRLIEDFLRQKIAPEILKGVMINPLIRFGKTVEETIAAAKEEQSDLIVMASGASGLARLFSGGLTERIVEVAPCPVLLVQPSAEVRTEADERVPIALIEKWAA